MAVRNCGGAVGRAEGVRPCGTSSSFRGDETTKPEPVLDGLDCINLEWKLHQSALGHGNVEQSTDEPWTAPERTGVSCHIHGAGSERPGQELDSSRTGWSLDDFVLAAICHSDDVVLAAALVIAAEVMVA